MNYLKAHPIQFLVICLTILIIVWRGIFYIYDSYGIVASIVCFIVAFTMINLTSKRIANKYKQQLQQEGSHEDISR